METEGKMRRQFIIAIITFLLLGASVSTTYADLEWKPLNDNKTYNYRDIACNDKGMYIVVGDDGLIKASTDLNNWSVQDSGTNQYLFGCTWGNGKFVSVGHRGTIVYSGDGLNWSKVELDNNIDFEDVTWGNGKFMAVGSHYPLTGRDDTRYVLLSIDGINWEIVLEKKGSFAWNDIKFLNNHFIAFGLLSNIGVSSDGVNWDVENHAFNDIIWDGKQYVAVGSNSAIWTSANTSDWNLIQSNIKGGLFLGKIVKFNNDYVLTLSNSGSNYLLTSKNLKEWSLASDRSYSELNSFIIERNKLIAVGWYETILQSSDVNSWNISKRYSPNFLKVIWDGTKFLSIGNNGSVYISNDGLKWTSYKIEIKDALIDVVWTGNEFYALGIEYDVAPNNYDILNTYIYRSDDGTKWTYQGSINQRNIDKIFYFNNRFFAIGRKGEILTSNDAVNWSSETSGTEYWLRDLVWNGKQYICVGMFGEILSSVDGTNWVQQVSCTKNDFNRIIWNGQMFVAIGSWKTVARSTDGVNWTADAEDNSQSYKDFLWNGESFLILQSNGDVLITEDTKQLTKISNKAISAPLSLAWNGERYVLVGLSGTMAVCMPKDIVKVKVQDIPIVFDVAPKIINDRTMIPARAVLEQIGSSLDWDEKTKTINVTKDNIKITLTVDSNVAYINGKEVLLEAPATIIKDRTLLPLRFIAENLGQEVKWDQDTNTVIIGKTR